MLIAGEWVLKKAQQRGTAEIIKLGRQQRTRNGATVAWEHLVIEITTTTTPTTTTTTTAATTTHTTTETSSDWKEANQGLQYKQERLNR